MKHVILFLFSICISFMLHAQVSKTVNVTAGGLSAALTPTEKSTVTNLKVTGTIDSRDFVTMRDNMPLLAVIDLSGAVVTAYSSYPANSIPEESFGSLNGIRKTSLTTFIFPSLITSIGRRAFYNCSGLTGQLTIPTSITTIGSSAFSGCSKLTSVTIPSSVTTIDSDAFSGCSRLTGLLNIPSSVTSIGYGAFSSCSKLTSVSIPSSVTTIQSGTFLNCSGLTSVSIPTSVTTIGEFAFSGCSGLTGLLNIPSSVTSIGSSAFSGCSGLTGLLNIPSSVTSIGSSAFSGCSKLTSVTIPASVTSIGSSSFLNCSGLNSVSIPTSVTTIGSSAFSGCSSISSVIIPVSVTSIDQSAFENCSGLTSIYVNSSYPEKLISTYPVFEGVNKNNCILYVPYGTRDIYATAFGWKDFMTIIAEKHGFLLGTNTIKLAAAEASNATTSIKTNVAWTASSDQTWLTISPASGNNDKQVSSVDGLQTSCIRKSSQRNDTFVWLQSGCRS